MNRIETREAPTVRFGLGRSGEGLVRKGGIQEGGTGARYELITGSVLLGVGIAAVVASSFVKPYSSADVLFSIAGVTGTGLGVGFIAAALGAGLLGGIAFGLAGAVVAFVGGRILDRAIRGHW